MPDAVHMVDTETWRPRLHILSSHGRVAALPATTHGMMLSCKITNLCTCKFWRYPWPICSFLRRSQQAAPKGKTIPGLQKSAFARIASSTMILFMPPYLHFRLVIRSALLRPAAASQMAFWKCPPFLLGKSRFYKILVSLFDGKRKIVILESIIQKTTQFMKLLFSACRKNSLRSDKFYLTIINLYS